MWGQLDFGFTAGAVKPGFQPMPAPERIARPRPRRTAQPKLDFSGVAMEKAEPKKKKVLTCLRCDAKDTLKKELSVYQRICNDCKNPNGKARRRAHYMDDVTEYSIAIRSRTGAW